MGKERLPCLNACRRTEPCSWVQAGALTDHPRDRRTSDPAYHGLVPHERTAICFTIHYEKEEQISSSHRLDSLPLMPRGLSMYFRNAITTTLARNMTTATRVYILEVHFAYMFTSPPFQLRVLHRARGSLLHKRSKALLLLGRKCVVDRFEVADIIVRDFLEKSRNYSLCGVKTIETKSPTGIATHTKVSSSACREVRPEPPRASSSTSVSFYATNQLAIA
jgi:hypothetical protein